jgi:hypothetical protein
VVRSLAQIDVQFSEAVDRRGRERFALSQVAPATGLTPLGNNAYRFTFPAQPNGPVSVTFATGHGIVDTESPPVAFAGASWSYTIDPNAPLEPVRINEVIAANSSVDWRMKTAISRIGSSC